ncbi:MAG: tRNA (adenosine(37)-N6)-threonylcarbamoyltransferase complex dimerization subunit type 1 TsaB [Bdellovibrionales bacterium]|nr:tRNA (adenosine(37)-N6)-threonylcarbamoyltransferase complex dimerization subunit type 1 TsaB [Bdellovibrionales bacterium]
MSEYILCCDTSSKVGSLALFSNSGSDLKLLSSKVWTKEKSHSEVITEQCDDLFKEASLSIHKISYLVSTIGPGSFTGIRVGLNFVRTLAFANSIPIYSFNSLAPLAYPYRKSNLPILVINNAHKNMLYTAIYQNEKESLSACALGFDELEEQLKQDKYLCLGDGFPTYKDFFSDVLLEKLILPKEDYVSSIAQTLGEMWKNWRKIHRPMSWNDLLPLYIRSSEAEEKLWSGLLRPAPKQ